MFPHELFLLNRSSLPTPPILRFWQACNSFQLAPQTPLISAIFHISQAANAIDELEQRLEVADRDAKRREALLAESIALGKPRAERAKLQKTAKVAKHNSSHPGACRTHLLSRY